MASFNVSKVESEGSGGGFEMTGPVGSVAGGEKGGVREGRDEVGWE